MAQQQMLQDHPLYCPCSPEGPDNAAWVLLGAPLLASSMHEHSFHACDEYIYATTEWRAQDVRISYLSPKPRFQVKLSEAFV